MPEGFVAVARVLAPRGLSGGLKIEPLAPLSVLARGARLFIGASPARVQWSRRQGRFLHIKLQGIDSREQARALGGRHLLLPEEDLPPLPPGEYYRFQLIGLTVRASDGRRLGTLEDVLPKPAGDVYLVDGPFGEILIPAHEDFVLAVDLETGMMTVDAVPGLIPESPSG